MLSIRICYTFIVFKITILLILNLKLDFFKKIYLLSFLYTIGKAVELRYVLNYDPRINEIITETKYMEQLGYPIPDIARNLALQEDKFARYALRLKKMLDNYHMLLASLDESETQLLDEHLHELKRAIRPGAKRLNWNALGINDYLSKCNSVIKTKPSFFFTFKIFSFQLFMYF